MTEEFEEYKRKLVNALEETKYHLQKNIADMDIENIKLNTAYQDRLYKLLRRIEQAIAQVEGYQFMWK